MTNALAQRGWSGIVPRMLLAFFLLSPLPMALLAFQFLGNAERTLTAKSIDSLTALSNKKVNEIDAYMSSKLRESRVLATGADTRNALRELAALGTTSATYASVLQTQRDLFLKLTEGAGVRNLLLVDDAGRVVFTLRPGVPLGTRLLASPYRETALAQGYRTALAQLDTQITRAQALPGIDSEVALFMVAPILDTMPLQPRCGGVFVITDSQPMRIPTRLDCAFGARGWVEGRFPMRRPR